MKKPGIQGRTHAYFVLYRCLILLFFFFCMTACDRSPVSRQLKNLESKDWMMRENAARALTGCAETRVIEPLIRHLQDERVEVSFACVKALSSSTDPRTVPALLDSLESRQPGLRKAVIEALTAISGENITAEIRTCLSDTDAGVRSAAAHSLGVRNDTLCVDALIKGLADCDTQVQKACLLSLCAMPCEKTVPAILKFVGDKYAELDAETSNALHDLSLAQLDLIVDKVSSQEAAIRKGALWICGLSREAKGIEPLCQAVQDPTVRDLAIRALALCDTPGRDALLPWLSHDDHELRSAVAGQLSSAGYAPSTDEERAVFLMALGNWEQLANLGSAAVDTLVGCLDDSVPAIRSASAAALGKVGGPRAVRALSGCLGDSDTDVRLAVVSALTHIGSQSDADRAAVVDAVKPLLNEKDPVARNNAFQTIGSLGDPGAVALLSPYLHDKDSEVRSHAIEAIGPCQDASVVPTLLAVLKGKDNGNRTSAAKALAHWHEPRVVDALLACLNESFPSDSVTQAAAEALGEMKEVRALKSLMTVQGVGIDERPDSVFVQAAVKYGDAAIEPLMGLLATDSSRTRIRAAFALGQLGDKRATAPLITILDDQYAEVRSAAADALGKLDYKPVEPDAQAVYSIAKRSWEEVVTAGNTAVPILLKRIGQYSDSQMRYWPDNAVRWSMVKALGLIADKRALPILGKMLQKGDYNTVLVEALDRLGYEPQSDRERVRMWAGRNDTENLDTHWDMAKRHLLADLNLDGSASELAFRFLEDKATKELKRMMDNGAGQVIELGLNSSNPELSSAAREAAEQHGFQIMTFYGSTSSRTPSAEF